jgi:hypothetical protein
LLPILGREVRLGRHSDCASAEIHIRPVQVLKFLLPQSDRPL